jgi:hypothetical protein
LGLSSILAKRPSKSYVKIRTLTALKWKVAIPFHFTFNIWLPRDSQEQASVGQKVPHFEDLQAGDILCFPGHVALYLGEGQMIHASGRYAQVVISKPDDPYSADLKSKFLFGMRVEAPPIRTHLRS